MGRYLAVAHQTSEAPEFVDAVLSVVERDSDAEFVLVVPATPVKHLVTWTEGESRIVAGEKAMAARRRLEEAGANVVDARVGDARPYEAVIDAVVEEQFDEVIVSTFAPGVSRWLKADLVHRLERSIDVPVTHVVAH